MTIFAYGSNMCFTRLKDRVPSARFVSVAKLFGYKLKLHKTSSDGSAKADAFETGDKKDVLWGIIFEINDNEKPQLDDAEGLGQGYDEKSVTLILPDNNTIESQIYYASSTFINDKLLPYSWYMDYIIVGAEDYGIAKTYVSELKKIKSKIDAKVSRIEKNEAVLLRHSQRT